MNSEALRAIIESNDDDLKILAQIAGGHPASFYRGANFDNADLRGQDLRGFNLQAATFRRTRVDRYTKVDPQYIKDAGLERNVKVQLRAYDSILEGLKNCDITLEKPVAEHLGDILEDALFGRKRAPKLSGSINVKWAASGKLTRNNSIHTASFDRTKHNFESTNVFVPVGSGKTSRLIQALDIDNDFVMKLVGDLIKRGRTGTALLSQRTGEYVMRKASHDTRRASDFCTATILSYTVVYSPRGILPKWLQNTLGPDAVVRLS